MGKFENKRVIRFVYQNRLFWRKNVVGEVDKERLLFAYQISKQIVHGRFPLNKELAFELTALMAQVKIFDIFGLFWTCLAFFWLFSVFFGHIKLANKLSREDF